MPTDLVRPRDGRDTIQLDHADLRFLDFRLLTLQPGETVELDTESRETALMTVAGAGAATAGGDAYALSRRDVFQEMTSLLYVPPAAHLTLSATTSWQVAVGTAPAQGRYPVRLITPDEMAVEIRGGGTARRQVNHPLAHPLPAERLIVYEAYVPAGSWAGWPPHCHDGRHGSPYLEETYLFGFDRPDGFGLHRNYVHDGSYDEVYTVRDGDCVVVPRGFHLCTPAPGANMWILNFLAGDLVDDARATPPHFDPATTWITEDWSRAPRELPVVTPTYGGPR